MSYRLGEEPRRSSGQPTPVYDFLKSAEKQQFVIKQAQLGKQTNTERGEVNLQMKAHVYSLLTSYSTPINFRRLGCRTARYQ